MTTNREAKRAQLRQRLIEAAEIELREKGLKGLKARDVTARAGCALGALYNVVDDLDMLILEVNLRTLIQMGEALNAAVSPKGSRPSSGQDASPDAVMQALAATYTDFAIENHNKWLALFEHRLPKGHEVPDSYKQAHSALIEVIVPPLARLRPDLSTDELMLRARTTFAAVHGVVHLSLQAQFVGVPIANLKAEVKALVEAMTRGAALATP
ncbi:TetR/AcrR family transcriptional regulator [Roseibium algae]|uniref:TetR/AcrR family transcriptional regulator n=1 Tax=Roseibium algae TaxID=3123038 RepID=A0ABU8TMM7_9HYPH